MADLVSPSGATTNWTQAYLFGGMNRRRDATVLERPAFNQTASGNMPPQYMVTMINAYSDEEGVIRREPGWHKRKVDDRLMTQISSVKLFEFGTFVFADQTGSGTLLGASNASRVEAYPPLSNVAFTSFKSKTYAMTSEYPMWVHDGVRWRQTGITAKPSFGVTVQNRLWVSGILTEPTTVLASRADDETIFPADEPASNAAVTKAAFIDIGNLIGARDKITGLGAFEGDKLAIFTNDQSLVYRVDPDFSKWALDSRANLKIGCISHRSIVQVGQDLVFCSRHGVHSLSRSESNGITLDVSMLSRPIEPLYKALVKGTADKSTINGFYDQDESLIHFFFPRATGAIRLSAKVGPGLNPVNWYLGDSFNARCGDALAGDLVFAGQDSIYSPVNRSMDLTPYFDPDTTDTRPYFLVMTPVLWFQNRYTDKKTMNLSVQAAGEATLNIKAVDQENRELLSRSVEITAGDYDDEILSASPLSSEERLQFNAVFKGLTLYFGADEDDMGDAQIVSFGVERDVSDTRRR